MIRSRSAQRHCRARDGILALALVVSALTLLASSSPAAASKHRYVINPNTITWPFRNITYLDPRTTYPECPTCSPPHPASIERAIDAWNAAHVGYRFVKTTDANNANLVFFGSKYVKPRSCEGQESSPGYNFAQDWIIITGPCDRYMTSLLAAHELGHLLGLAHETKGCAAMNPHAIEPRGQPQLSYPEDCPPGKQYWRSPVHPDDRAGVLAIRARPTRWPYLMCFHANGSWSMAYARYSDFCSWQYDCRGQPGPAEDAPDLSQFAVCRRERYNKAAARGEYASVRASDFQQGGW